MFNRFFSLEKLAACAWLVLVACVLPGCNGKFPVASFAEQQGFTEQVFHGRTFDINWFSRGAAPTLRAFIEGDGKAWLNRRTPSSDPTPGDAVAFRLAGVDTSPAIAYLARPCQFVEGEQRRNCSTPFWTSARFSETVIRDMSGALDRAKAAAGATRLQLVGYSGGGAVALLLAERRDDVDLVVTIAGNLDHVFWTNHHHVSPLRESLNPADYARQLEAIRQIHIVSTDDAVIPPAVAQSYVSHMIDPAKVRIVTVDGVGHTDDWGRVTASVLRGMQ